MSGINKMIADWKKNNPTPAPAPTPAPTPTPTPDPTPAPIPPGNVWRAALFFPHKIYGTNTIPPWPGNQGVDSNLDFVSCHGNSWEKTKRRNGYAWVKDSGGDTIVIIAEKLYGNYELAMFLTNCKHPDGHQMNDKENEVVIARKEFGINHWVVSLFNDDETSIPSNKHEDYIKEMATRYSWATGEQVAFLICLETNERFNVAETMQRVKWVNQYAPGKRIIVGSAAPDFLKSIAGEAKKLGGTVELWLETAWHPFSTAMSNADQYLAALKDLMKTGMPVWAGEFGNGKDPCVTYIRKKSVEVGVVGYTELEKPSDDRIV